MTYLVQGTSALAEPPDRVFREADDPPIRTDGIYVLYTSIDDTLQAAKVAANFARPLSIPVTVVHIRTVPYALSVDEPTGLSPVETAAFTRSLRDEELEVRVRVYLCRDERQAISMAFKTRSLIVVGGHRSWWPSRLNRWCQLLETAGHFVMLAERLTHKESTHA